MGIPTVKREKQSYLMSTLRSLLYGLSEKQKNDCVIIIFVAEVSLHEKVQDTNRKTTQKFITLACWRLFC
uniref:MGAT4 conserved region domain-containing protein n=1 Tax=Pavo cristatus TaxID=9049 RepID=A0A8C9FHW1_PAVCR